MPWHTAVHQLAFLLYTTSSSMARLAVNTGTCSCKESLWSPNQLSRSSEMWWTLLQRNHPARLFCLLEFWSTDTARTTLHLVPTERPTQLPRLSSSWKTNSERIVMDKRIMNVLKRSWWLSKQLEMPDNQPEFCRHCWLVWRHPNTWTSQLLLWSLLDACHAVRTSNRLCTRSTRISIWELRNVSRHTLLWWDALLSQHWEELSSNWRTRRAVKSGLSCGRIWWTPTSHLTQDTRGEEEKQLKIPSNISLYARFSFSLPDDELSSKHCINSNS